VKIQVILGAFFRAVIDILTYARKSDLLLVFSFDQFQAILSAIIAIIKQRRSLINDVVIILHFSFLYKFNDNLHLLFDFN
jgi:hypothetical protein